MGTPWAKHVRGKKHAPASRIAKQTAAIRWLIIRPSESPFWRERGEMVLPNKLTIHPFWAEAEMEVGSGQASAIRGQPIRSVAGRWAHTETILPTTHR